MATPGRYMRAQGQFWVGGYALDSVNALGMGLVGRSPWTAANARTGRPLARAPAPHGSPDAGRLHQRAYPILDNRP